MTPKPKRRLFDLLKSQGLQANQDVTFLTDGGEEIRALTERVTPESEHVLDWFHITMRLTVLCQYARGVAHHDEAAGKSLLAELERIKWLLWHGNQHRAGETIGFFLDDVDGLEVDYPNLSKFARAAHEFAVYIASNAGSLINYGERFRAGERISSCLAESTVNAVISKRFAKRQQMQWTKRGAHLLLQTRTRALDGTLRPLFEKWYPGLGFPVWRCSPLRMNGSSSFRHNSRLLTRVVGNFMAHLPEPRDNETKIPASKINHLTRPWGERDFQRWLWWIAALLAASAVLCLLWLVFGIGRNLLIYSLAMLLLLAVGIVFPIVVIGIGTILIHQLRRIGKFLSG